MLCDDTKKTNELLLFGGGVELKHMSDSGCGDLDEKCPPRLWGRNIWTPAGAGGEV